MINIVFFIKSFKISFASYYLKYLQRFQGHPTTFSCKITVQRRTISLEFLKLKKWCLNIPFYWSQRCTYVSRRFSFSHFIAEMMRLLLKQGLLKIWCTKKLPLDSCDESVATRSMSANCRLDQSRKLKVSDETKSHQKIFETTKVPLRLPNSKVTEFFRALSFNQTGF